MRAGIPVSPHQVPLAKAPALPSCVIDAWNESIAYAWDGSRARVPIGDVVSRIVDKTGVDERCVWESGWLRCASTYEPHGWFVVYIAGATEDKRWAHFSFERTDKK